MKKTTSLLFASALLLTGCSSANANLSNGNETIMKIGDVTYTKNDEYNLLKTSTGANMTVELVRQAIYDKVVGREKDVMDEAQKKYDELSKSYDNLEEQITSIGYNDKDEYINKVLVPGVQADKLSDLYFKDGKDEIKKEYKPSLVKIIQCDDSKTAKKALEALKEGTDFTQVFEEYASENPTFKNEDTLITTASTTVPTRLVNTAYKTKEAGVIDEVFTKETKESTNSEKKDEDTTAYVAVLVSNNYDTILDQLKTSLKSNTTFGSQCFVHYLKQFNFEVHDQSVFDYLRKNNPDYLYQYPELTKTEEDK